MFCLIIVVLLLFLKCLSFHTKKKLCFHGMKVVQLVIKFFILLHRGILFFSFSFPKQEVKCHLNPK